MNFVDRLNYFLRGYFISVFYMNFFFIKFSYFGLRISEEDFLLPTLEESVAQLNKLHERLQ